MSYAASAFSNISQMPSVAKRSALDRKRAAGVQRTEEAQLKEKIEQANTILDRLEARQEAQAEAIRQLQRRKAATAARIERIEDEILTRMDEAGLKVLTGIRCSMRLQPSAEALEVIDQTKIPAEYMRSPKPSPAVPDKVAIKKALAANEELSAADWGCKLTSKISLVRK